MVKSTDMINKLKHYLGTGLVCRIYKTPISWIETELTGVSESEIFLEEPLYKHTIGYSESESFFPHLRPLSKLTEEITVKGYKDDKPFVALYELQEIFSHYKQAQIIEKMYDWDLSNESDLRTYALFLPYAFVDLLHQMHFNLYFKPGEFIEI